MICGYAIIQFATFGYVIIEFATFGYVIIQFATFAWKSWRHLDML